MLPDSATERSPGVSLPDPGDCGPPADIVVLGKIVGPYGLRGAVKVHPFADDAPAWSKLGYWWFGREGEEVAAWRRTRLTRCRLHGDVLVAELALLSDRTQAEAVQGYLVGVPRECLPAPADGEYYWADLVGLAVRNCGGQPLGRVLGLIETPANTVLRVGDGERAEQLLPFVAAVVLDVDLGAGTVTVDWEADW